MSSIKYLSQFFLGCESGERDNNQKCAQYTRYNSLPAFKLHWDIGSKYLERTAKQGNQDQYSTEHEHRN